VIVIALGAGRNQETEITNKGDEAPNDPVTGVLRSLALRSKRCQSPDKEGGELDPARGQVDHGSQVRIAEGAKISRPLQRKATALSVCLTSRPRSFVHSFGQVFKLSSPSEVQSREFLPLPRRDKSPKTLGVSR
jgi:hypothetical protein